MKCKCGNPDKTGEPRCLCWLCDAMQAGRLETYILSPLPQDEELQEIHRKFLEKGKNVGKSSSTMDAECS